jgi:hypothetical protein
MKDEETEEEWFKSMDRDANVAAVVVSLFLLALLGGLFFLVRM